ncbi:MAG: glycosyltransferase family 2 protein [Halioglobus sp.]|nr:glycosyltransferase family 2 protein [Halioglobus sp.]
MTLPGSEAHSARVEVSVILPVYNGQRYMREALDSVLQQQFDDARAAFELIVIDDGSTDDSADIIAEYARRDTRIRARRQDNAGVTAARNAGIAGARGRFLMFIDQDDRFTPGALQTHLAAYAREPELGYSLAQQRCFLQPGSEVPAWFKLQQLDKPVPGYLPGTLCARRETFVTLGTFDERFPISSDADWFARGRDAAVPMRLLPQVTLERRIHDANQSRHSSVIHRELAQLLGESIRRKRARS